jgi:hypothetical protein
MEFYPPHEVRDQAKFDGLLESFRLGKPIPPIATCGDVAYTGSHRLHAYEKAQWCWEQKEPGWENSPRPSLGNVEISDQEWEDATGYWNENYYPIESLDELEFNDICEAIYQATQDPELKAALEDQRG